MRIATLACAMLSTSLLSATALACNDGNCSLSPDAVGNERGSNGWHMNVQYQYQGSSPPRSADNTPSPSGSAQLNSASHQQTVSGGSVNRFLTLSLGQSTDSHWNFLARLPFTHGGHRLDTGLPSLALNPAPSVSSHGDISLIGGYQGWLANRNLGLQLGLKLPTADKVANRGSGNTALIIGSYYHQPFMQHLDAFIGGRYLSSVRDNNHAGDADSRPANRSSMRVGFRYDGHPEVVPRLQFNVIHSAHDQGVLADHNNSGGTVVYLSPGMTLNPAASLQLYGFIQAPMYSDLTGSQPLPSWTATVGFGQAI
ncbi:MAG: hypothetical protein R3292_10525 [Alcanivorax sp.]|nr:hypothetical protein [Alcanivorax sp.]